MVLLLTACRLPPPVVGLRPLSPAASYGMESWFPAMTYSVLPDDVESVQPLLRWQAFPRPRDLELDEAGRLAHLGPVRYDLRIWQELDDAEDSAALVYERTGLPEPEHRVERPLAAASLFHWSVRARFELDGRTRVTPWSFSQLPYDVSRQGAGHAQRIVEVRWTNYFAFRTP